MKKLLMAGAVCLALYSCKKAELDELPTATVNGKMKTGEVRSISDSVYVPTNLTVPSLAGQTIDAGTVNVTNDGTNLFVTYSTKNGWTMTALHLYVGEYENAPQTNSGNPIPGRFPFSVNFATPQTSYTFTLPLADYPSCFIVAAHSVVKNGTQTQTSWTGDLDFPGNNWGTYFAYCKLSSTQP